MPEVAAARRRPQQLVEIVHTCEHERFIGREPPPGRKIFQQFAHLAIIHDLRPMAIDGPRSLFPDRLAPIDAGAAAIESMHGVIVRRVQASP